MRDFKAALEKHKQTDAFLISEERKRNIENCKQTEIKGQFINYNPDVKDKKKHIQHKCLPITHPLPDGYG